MGSGAKWVAGGVALAAVAGVATWQFWPALAGDSTPITVGTTDAVGSLDPAGSYDAGSWALYGNVFQSLLTLRPGSDTPVPDAASRCGFDDPAKLTVYSCELRTGLKFTNGRTVTGEDVKYSIDRIRKIKADQGPAPLFANIASVAADGAKVVFTLSRPDATFPFKIATGAASIVDKDRYPAGSLREGDEVDGSGQFALTSYTAGQKAELKPNENWQGEGKAARQNIEVRYFKDGEALQKAWKDRTVDVAHRDLPPATLAGLGPTLKDTRYQESGGTEIRNMLFNTRSGSAFGKKQTRQAVAALLDRPKIAQEVYKGTVTPLYSLIPAGVPGHSTPFSDTYAQPSLDAARALLREGTPGAGTAAGPVKFTLGVYDRSTNVPEAQNIKKQLEAGGLFSVTIRAVGDWTAFQQGYARGEYDAYTVGWIPDFPDADNFVDPLIGSGSSMNTGWSDKTVDALVARTQSHADRGEAVNDFKALQRTAAVEVPVLPIWQKKDYVVSRENISGIQYLSDGSGVWRLWELSRT
ncbi:ABC transporter substrate-binding protein [Streptomyces sp. BI20]|uniref:ABC transporter substrate-binding protein n=1 Tax=Streptomyces sp. BI20 TaxID=3403460 RepID=UPI003C769052